MVALRRSDYDEAISQLEQRYGVGGILGKSRPMQALFQLLDTVAPSSSTGQTGYMVCIEVGKHQKVDFGDT